MKLPELIAILHMLSTMQFIFSNAGTDVADPIITLAFYMKLGAYVCFSELREKMPLMIYK